MFVFRLKAAIYRSFILAEAVELCLALIEYLVLVAVAAEARQRNKRRRASVFKARAGAVRARSRSKISSRERSCWRSYKEQQMQLVLL
jgi:hypothetical protein